MAKKTKAKQKSDDKPAGNNVGSNAAPPEPSVMSTTVTEINYKADPPAQPEAVAWGTDTGSWGMPEAQPAGDTWGTSTHDEVAWADDPESLLQPPLHQSHLPTIPEHVSPGGHSTQLRPSLSDIGESQQSREDSYGNDTWSGHQESPAPHYADGQQSHTLTATAAPSAIGSPAIHPAISLKEAITRAQARGGTGVSSASEAARKLEESRARPKARYIKNNTTSPAARYETLKDNSNHAQGGQLHPPMSSASAAAALLESTSNRLRAQGHSAPKPPQQTVQAPPGKTKWEYHGRPAAAITPDPSWIMTGGNAWSNKHRQTKSATVHWGTGNENRTQQAWDAQQNQQQHHPAPSVHPRQRPQQQKHYSHPGHPMHQQSKQGQGQSWQGWGKNEWQEEDEVSETETEMTDDVWNRQEGNGWGQGSNSGWDQHAGGEWVQHPQQNRQPGRSGQDPGRSRKNKRHDDGYGQADGWGHQGGGWDKEENGWGQSNDGWSQTLGRGQGRGQEQGRQRVPSENGWGAEERDGWDQHESGWGKTADGGWGKAADSTWGKAHDTGWTKTADAGWGTSGEWGGHAPSNSEWGAAQQTNDTGPSRAQVSEQQKAQILNSLLNQGQTQKNPSNMMTAQLQAAQQLAASLQAQLAGIQSAISQGQKNGTMTAIELQTAQQQGATLQRDLAMVLSSLGQTQKNAGMTTAQQAAQQHAAQIQAHLAAVQGAKPPPKAKPQDNRDAWEAYDDDGWGSVDSSDDEYDPDRRVHFSPKTSDLWGGSPHSVPSKTLLQAQQRQGVATTPLNLDSNVHFVESRGAAFTFVSNAFFGNSRFARERIHWMFPANKDDRVASMLAWVQKMSFNLATYGLTKFLETRERGALFVNVVFRMQQHPKEPAFDWLTFNQLQGTMDKTLQESTAFYDPARLVTVFVYLPSQSGNSVAIWRRKVNVPDSARLKYQAEINAVMKNLRTAKDYVVMVDELPKAKSKVPQKPGQLRKSVKAIPLKNAKSPAKEAQKAQKKRKWWKFFLS